MWLTKIRVSLYCDDKYAMHQNMSNFELHYTLKSLKSDNRGPKVILWVNNLHPEPRGTKSIAWDLITTSKVPNSTTQQLKLTLWDLKFDYQQTSGCPK